MTDAVYEVLDRYADTPAEELAKLLRVSSPTIRYWRSRQRGGEPIRVREYKAREAIRKAQQGPKPESAAHLEGFLEAIQAMRNKLDELEQSVLPPPGDATRFE